MISIVILNTVEAVNFGIQYRYVQYLCIYRFIGGIGLLLGCLLLYCILFKTSSDIGYFKYLQKIITLNYKFCLTLLGSDTQLFVCLYVTCYGSLIIIVVVNFLYRLWAVRSPEKSRLFGKFRFLLTLFVTIFVLLLVWLCACYFLFEATPIAREELREQMMTKYGVDSMTRAMMIGNYKRDDLWNLRPICGLALLAIIIGGAIALIIYSSISIVIFLRQTKVMSERTQQLQYALFRMLAIQATIPIVLVHGCSGAQLTLPLFGVNIELYSDISTTIFSFLTPLDSLSVILLMKDYRQATLSILKCSGIRRIAVDMISKHRLRRIENQPNTEIK